MQDTVGQQFWISPIISLRHGNEELMFQVAKTHLILCRATTQPLETNKNSAGLLAVAYNTRCNLRCQGPLVSKHFLSICLYIQPVRTL